MTLYVWKIKYEDGEFVYHTVAADAKEAEQASERYWWNKVSGNPGSLCSIERVCEVDFLPPSLEQTQ